MAKLTSWPCPTLNSHADYPGMWRVQWADGSLSDITNLTRAQDAAACFFETEERRHRGRQSLSEGRRCVVGTRMAR